MNKLLTIFSLLILCSCKAPVVYAWTLSDLIRVWVFGILLAFGLIALLCAWVYKTVKACNITRKKNKAAE
jgi:hypothetical protein